VVFKVLVATTNAERGCNVVALFQSEQDICVVGQAASRTDVLASVEDSHPDVVIIDSQSLELDALCITSSLTRGQFHPAVLILAPIPSEDEAIDAIQAGAAGYCTDNDESRILIQAIRSLALGDVVISPQVLRHLCERLIPRPSTLASECSRRELEVLSLLTEGASNVEIAGRLYISEATVRTHIQHLRMKLDVKSRAAMVAMALRLGLISVDFRTC
jgi:DNA-binding NarL/FixJ family response regulator